jgi:hypothetical protein
MYRKLIADLSEFKLFASDRLVGWDSYIKVCEWRWRVILFDKIQMAHIISLGVSGS